MKGLDIRKAKTGHTLVRLHYSVDPSKDAAWVAKARTGMARWMWLREYEIDFGAAGGRLVYDMWDPSIHEVVLGNIPDTWTRYRALDHGLANPTAILWAAVDPENNVHIYREYYHAERIIAENCHEALGMEGPTEKPRMTWGDPSVTQRDAKTGTSLADEYAKHGISITPGNNRLGHEIVCSYLISALAKWSRVEGRLHEYFKEGDPAKVDALANQPAIYFGVACPNTIREHKNLRFADVVGNPEDHNVKERSVDKDDHATDAIRYLLAAEPRYRKPVDFVPYERKSMMRHAAV